MKYGIWNGKILNKNFFKEVNITVETLIKAIKEKIKTHKDFENIKFDRRTPKEIMEILEIIEIENLYINLRVGTPFISSTISLVILLASIIPVIYEKTDNRKGKLFYNVEPNFNDFKFVGEINLNFKITLLEIIWISNYLKKKNNKKTKRRKKYEQSSYRGIDEYSYE